jgi:hypothetical protein
MRFLDSLERNAGNVFIAAHLDRIEKGSDSQRETAASQPHGLTRAVLHASFNFRLPTVFFNNANSTGA